MAKESRAKQPKRKSHPYADLFPMMNAVELEALAADIKENGLDQPIVLYGDLVLDGRNRLAACEMADVEPTFVTFDGEDAGAFAKVISLNVQRRDLTSAQRAIVAARATNTSRGRPEKNSTDGAIFSIEHAAKVFKVGVNSIKQCRALLVEAPDLVSQVESCGISLATAYEELVERRANAKQKQKDAARVAEFSDAISSGEMTIDDAIQQAMEQEREQQQIAASQADACRTTLRKLAEFINWIEPFGDRTDEELAWYGKPDTPGMFEHGLTTERVAAASELLGRFAVHAFTKDANRGKVRKK